MNIPHRKISVDINRLTPLSVKLIGNVGDKNTRYLDLQLTANNKLIEFEEGCTATVTYAVDRTVIAENVPCDIEDNTLIIGFDSETVANVCSGILKIQPKIIDAEDNVFVLQIPIYVYVTNNIAEQGRS